MTRAVQIPEILYLICEQVPRPDLARLLTTSRLFFDCLVPLVWSNLPPSAPVILLKLLPNSDTHLEHHLRDKFVEGLQPLAVQSLVRFNLYAPHVRQVAQDTLFDGTWCKLLKLVDTRPILPNLEVLKVLLKERVRDAASYLDTWLTPTLTEIDYAYHGHPFLEPHVLSGSVSSMARRCPNIHSLNLSYVARHITLEPAQASELANSLSRLRNLRTLGLGPVALDPKVLVALGSLPHLQSLTLNEAPNTGGLSSEGTLKSIDVSLSDSSFPNLQHLGIDPCYEFESVISMWNIIAFVQRLTSVSVRLGPEASVAEPQFHDFIRAICRNSPFVSALSLACDSSTYITLFSPQIAENVAQLPLQRLCLLENVYTSRDYDRERFALAFPRLGSLQTHEYFYFKDLRYIAKHMPQLQELSARIIVDEDWPSREELSSFKPTPSPSRLCFHIQIYRPTPGWRGVTEVRGRIPYEKVLLIATGLHALWPKGMICVPAEGGSPDQLGELNATLERLREVG